MIYLTEKSNKTKPNEKQMNAYFNQFTPAGRRIMQGFFFMKVKFFEISDDLKSSYDNWEKADIALYCIDAISKSIEIAEELLTDHVAALSDDDIRESLEEAGSPFMAGMFPCNLAISTCGMKIDSGETLSWVLDDDKRKGYATEFLDDLTDKTEELLANLKKDPNFPY